MGVTTDRKPLTRTPYHSPRKKQYHIFKKLDADYLAKELETALEKAQEAVKNAPEAKENAATDGDVKYSMQILPDGTEYVKLDKNVGKTDREVFNSLVGKPIFTNDGDVILIVKRLSRIDMFHELMRRLPKWNRGMSLDELKRINHEVNQNIDDAINASRFAGNKDDVDDRHAESGIASFDTRSVVVADNQNAYDFDIAIAVLGDGRKIGYAKKYLGTNAEMWKKIKEAEDGRTISPNAQLPAEAGNASTDSVPQSSEKSNSKFSMKIDSGIDREIETALNESDVYRQSKDNNKNNLRIRAWLNEHYPDLSVTFFNDKATGAVTISSVMSKEQAEQERVASEERARNERLHELARQRFWERMRSYSGNAKLRESIENHLRKDGIDATVSRSRSSVGTLSFYVKSGDTTIKVSDHNTIRQELDYPDTRFINLHEMESFAEVYDKVKSILLEENDDAVYNVNSVEGAKFSRKLGQNETMEGGTDGSNEGGLLREVSGVLSQNERGDNSTVLGRGAKIAERKQFKRPGDFTEADLRKLTTDFSRLIDGHLSEEGRVLLKAFEQDSHGVDRFAQDVYSSCTNSLAEAELRWMDYIPNIHEVYDAFADAFPGKENEDVKKSRKLLPPTDEAERLDIEVQSKLATLQSELEKAKKRADYWQGQTKRTKEPSVRMEDVRALTRRMLSDFMSTATVGKIAPQVKALADFIVSGHDGTEELTWLGAKARALDIAEQIIGSAWAPKGTDVYGSYIFDAESVYGVSTDELRKHIAGYELYITRGEMEDIADYQIWRKHLPRYIHLHYTEDRRNSNVDTLYNDLRGKYPHVFTQEANTGAEQLQAIIDGVNKLETEYENPYRNVCDKWEEIVANTLIDSVIDESVRQTPPTFADRQARKLLEQQLVSDKRIAKLRADRDKKISDIKKHYRKVAEDKRTRRSESEERFSLTKLTKSSMTKMAHRPSI